jgi:Glycosyltransferase like family
MTTRITLAVAVNDRVVLEANLLASPALGESSDQQILLQQEYSSAAQAYNHAIDQSTNDLMVFLHQDMYLPAGWFARLAICIAQLDRKDSSWGVAGCWGTTRTGAGFGHVYSPGVEVLGGRFDDPEQVQALDEIVLVMRRSRGLRFDEGLGHFHFYGADLCLQAQARGMRAYAISDFCIHNANYQLVLPREFYDGYRYMKRKWRAQLPVHTPCVRISRFDRDLRERKMQEFFRRVRGRLIGQFRSQDPAGLYERLQSSYPQL